MRLKAAQIEHTLEITSRELIVSSAGEDKLKSVGSRIVFCGLRGGFVLSFFTWMKLCISDHC